MIEVKTGAWIQTYTGKQFYPFDPDPTDIDILDIAVALSNQCRFAGHVSEFYSVAEHSVRVSDLLPSNLALYGLLHDASEAYLLDMPKPIKDEESMKDYKLQHAILQQQIMSSFGLNCAKQLRHQETIHSADMQMLCNEAHIILPNKPIGWGKWFDGFTPKQLYSPICWTPSFAREMFLKRYDKLTGRERDREGIDELADSQIADRAERSDREAWRRDGEYRRNQ